jgi:hypothetical protein
LKLKQTLHKFLKGRHGRNVTQGQNCHGANPELSGQAVAALNSRLKNPPNIFKFVVTLFACPAYCNCPLGKNVNRFTGKDQI